MANPFRGDDQEDFEAAGEKETGKIKQTGLPKSAKLSTFGAAFNAARPLVWSGCGLVAGAGFEPTTFGL